MGCTILNVTLRDHQLPFCQFGEIMSKDPNYAVKIEQAIAAKYGEETIQNPKKTWNEDKEKEYFSTIERVLPRTETRRGLRQERSKWCFHTKKTT